MDDRSVSSSACRSCSFLYVGLKVVIQGVLGVSDRGIEHDTETKSKRERYVEKAYRKADLGG